MRDERLFFIAINGKLCRSEQVNTEQTALACPSNSTPKMALTHIIQTNCQLHWRFTNRKRAHPLSRARSLTHPDHLRRLAVDKPINTQT